MKKDEVVNMIHTVMRAATINLLVFIFIGYYADAFFEQPKKNVVICQYINATMLPQSEYIQSVLSAVNFSQHYQFDYKLIHVNESFYNEMIGAHESWISLFGVLSFMSCHNDCYYDYIMVLDPQYKIAEPKGSLLQLLKEFHFPDNDCVISTEASAIEISGASSSTIIFQFWKNNEKNKQFILNLLYVMKKYPRVRFDHDMLFIISDRLDKSQQINLSVRSSSNKSTIISFDRTYNLDNLHLDSLFPHLMKEFESQLTIYEKKKNDSLFLSNYSFFYHFFQFPSIDFVFGYSRPNQTEPDIIELKNPAVLKLSFFHDSLKVRFREICRNEFMINDIVCEEGLHHLDREILKKRNEQLNLHALQWYEESFRRHFPDWGERDSDKYHFYHDFLSPAKSVALKHLQNNKQKVIMTIFAGRRSNLQILMKYLIMALDLFIIDEIHLWDFCRDDEDSMYLLSLADIHKGIFIKQRYTPRYHWADYYEYYYQHSLFHPNDIIMKCDDDILFIDVLRLPYFLSLLNNDAGNKYNGALFANIINNAVAAHYQQSVWNILPESIGEFEFPEGGLFGSIFFDSTKLTRLHQYFLSNWKSIINGQDMIEGMSGNDNYRLHYDPEVIPVTNRFSINFFAVKAINWYKIRDIGDDDELHLTVSTVNYGLLDNYLVGNFIVGHLAYTAQLELESFNISGIRDAYDQLFHQYSAYVDEYLLTTQD